MNEEQQELIQQQQQSMIDQNKENKMKKDMVFNTSDFITFNLKETDPEFYKEIQERADEAKKRLAEQGLEIVEADDIFDFATNPNLKTTTYVISMNKETGVFHYYEDDNNE